MNAEEYLKYLAASRERTKILDPYRGEIICLKPTLDITSAIIYDHLCERHEAFYTVIQKCQAFYVMTLREELGIPTEAKVRQYTEVSEQISGSGRYGAEGYDRPRSKNKKSTYSPWS